MDMSVDGRLCTYVWTCLRVSDAKGSFGFITFFYQLIDCYMMINYRITFSETSLFSCLVCIKGFFSFILERKFFTCGKVD